MLTVMVTTSIVIAERVNARELPNSHALKPDYPEVAYAQMHSPFPLESQ